MIKGTTKSGFEFEVDPRTIQNMEFIEMLDDIEDENPQRWARVAKTMLGKEQKKRFYDHLRDEDGFVPIEATVTELVEMMTIVNESAEGKN